MSLHCGRLSKAIERAPHEWPWRADGDDNRGRQSLERPVILEAAIVAFSKTRVEARMLDVPTLVDDRVAPNNSDSASDRIDGMATATSIGHVALFLTKWHGLDRSPHLS